jgi:Trk K+ transport system NAD-binding subunit
MTENMQADSVQSRQAGFVRCCLKLKDISKVGEVLVERGGNLCGKTVGEVESELGTRIYMILRDELSIIAYETTKLKVGDIVILRADNIERNSSY